MLLFHSNSSPFAVWGANANKRSMFRRWWCGRSNMWNLFHHPSQLRVLPSTNDHNPREDIHLSSMTLWIRRTDILMIHFYICSRSIRLIVDERCSSGHDNNYHMDKAETFKYPKSQFISITRTCQCIKEDWCFPDTETPHKSDQATIRSTTWHSKSREHATVEDIATQYPSQQKWIFAVRT